MNTKTIPIFIVSYNRLSCLKKLINFLEQNNYTNIHIIDNKSSYIPLLEYYNTLPYQIHRMDKNYGHLVLFKAKEFKEIISNNYFVLTDSDVVPIDECPEDFINIFMDILNQYSNVTKVGFSLKIDDIPDYYKLRDNVLTWESQFYMREIEFNSKCSIYEAGIDTTFALYRPMKSINIDNNFFKAFRTGYPYQARHLPWYQNSNQLTEEDLFYIKVCNNSINNWNKSATQLELMERYGEKKRMRLKLFLLLPFYCIMCKTKIEVRFLNLPIFLKKIKENGKVLIKLFGIPIITYEQESEDFVKV